MARPTLVLLVRHALTASTGRILPGRAPGLRLSAEGARQAEALARRIGGGPRVTAVYTSPLERARETAAVIARALGLGVGVEPGFLECDFGRWTGRSLARLRRTSGWRAIQHHPSGFRFPGGESFVEMQARIASAIGRIVGAHPRQTVVAVSHADPIRVAVVHAVGAHLDTLRRIVIAPASVTAIAYGPLAPTVLTVNSVGGDLAWLGRS
jgi:probable phosphoglycerate mutase